MSPEVAHGLNTSVATVMYMLSMSCMGRDTDPELNCEGLGLGLSRRVDSSVVWGFKTGLVVMFQA